MDYNYLAKIRAQVNLYTRRKSSNILEGDFRWYSGAEAWSSMISKNMISVTMSMTLTGNPPPGPARP